MSMLTSSGVDIDLIAQALLKNNTFLMALSQNDVFVSGLSKNNKFVSAVSDNPVFIAKTRDRVNEELDDSFELRLIHASSEPLNRLVKLETITGLTDFSEFYEDEEGIKQPRTPSIPERIKNLEDKIKNYSPMLTVSSCIDKIPESKTEQRAVCLAEAVEASEKGFFSGSEITDYLKYKLPDSCKLDENIQNIRKVKQDVIKKVEKMFSHIKKNKKEYGHQDVRLVVTSRNLLHTA